MMISHNISDSEGNQTMKMQQTLLDDGACHLEYIDKEVWKRFQACDKERKAKNILRMAIILKNICEDLHEWMMQKIDLGSHQTILITLQLLQPIYLKKKLLLGFADEILTRWTSIGNSNDCYLNDEFYRKRRRVRSGWKNPGREAEVKRVVNTGNRVEKPVWTNANRVNHANQFVPRSVQLNAGRPKLNSVRPNINTGRTNINSVRPKVNAVSPKVNTVRSKQPVTHKTSNSSSPKRPQMNQMNQRRDFSKSYSSVRRPFANSTAQMANAVMGRWGSAVKTSASYTWRNSRPNFNYNSGPTFIRTEHPLKNMVDRGIFDSGCSGHMTGNKDQLEDFEEFNGGSVTFGGSKGYISGKGRIRVGNLDFDSVSFVKELGHFNLFSISQICDKQHKVLFTETECLVVSSDFKMPDENQILLKVPRHHNMYSFDMKTPSPAKGFACLIAKATSDESKLWHRRLGHINFKNLNKLVKGNLVRGLPSKVFKYDHTCVACHKGKQHRASCKAKLERLITVPLHTLHMDLFGPTSVKSINHASYCLVITDDCTRFSWVFFLASKDETSGILQTFIRQIENQLSHRVKIIRSDNGTEFKNRDMLEFCGNKGIKQEYSNARTPQQNGVAERMNRTLIEAARTMLADSLLPTTFWAEAVSTACYIFNRVRVTKPQNKTPYELLFGHKPIISYIRPFGCHVTILDTLSVLGKFDGKSDEGFLISTNVKGVGYRWMFDIDYLTDSMNYIPVSLENQANPHAGASEVSNSAGTSQTQNSNASEEKDEDVELIVVPSAVKNTEEKVESRTSSAIQRKSLSCNGIGRVRSTSRTDGNWYKWATEIKEMKEEWLSEIRQDWWPKGTRRKKVKRFMSHKTPGFVDSGHPKKVYKWSKLCMDYIKLLELGKEGIMLVQVGTPRTSHLNLVKRIFNDYGGSNLDRKSNSGCQFLGTKTYLMAMQNQSIVATSLQLKLKYVLLQIIAVDKLLLGSKSTTGPMGLPEIVDFLRGSNLRTPLKTVNASGEEQVEDLPYILRAATILLKLEKDQVKLLLKKLILRPSIKVSTVPFLPDRGRREGKLPMTEDERTQAFLKTQKNKFFKKEEAGLAARPQFEAQSYTEEDWDTIRAKLKANAELRENVLGRDSFCEDYAKKDGGVWLNQRRNNTLQRQRTLGAKRNMPHDSNHRSRNYMSNFLKNQGTWKLTQLKKLNFEEVKAEFENLIKQLDSYVPMNLEATKGKFDSDLFVKSSKLKLLEAKV
ncbi:putative ribonuclease H-like domain-containing protein [Tanacetum coccineum]